MTVAGITGTMGSGKSYVCKAFASLGVPIYDCDSRAKELLNLPELREAIVKEQGEGLYVEGKWDRNSVSKRVIDKPELLTEITKLLSPFVIEDLRKWKTENAEKALGLVESAILFKSKNLLAEMDFTIVVDATHYEKMARIKKRDPFRTRKEIEVLLKNQAVNFQQGDIRYNNNAKNDPIEFARDLIERTTRFFLV